MSMNKKLTVFGQSMQKKDRHSTDLEGDRHC